MVRKGFTLIELVFAIVVIAISVMSLPMMMQVNSKGMEQNLVQEAIFASIAEMNYAIASPWDDHSLMDDADGRTKVLNVLNGCTLSDLVDYGETVTTIKNIEKTGNIMDVADRDSISHSLVTFKTDSSLQTLAGGRLIIKDAANGGIDAGYITIAADGAYTFTPATDYSGTVEPITYLIKDNTNLNDMAQIILNIIVADTATDAVDDDEEVPVLENNNKIGNVLNVIDTNSNSHSVRSFKVKGYQTIYSTPDEANILGKYRINIRTDGSYIFTPNPDFKNNIEVTYTVVDNNDLSDEDNSTLTINVLSQSDEKRRKGHITRECVDSAEQQLHIQDSEEQYSQKYSLKGAEHDPEPLFISGSSSSSGSTSSSGYKKMYKSDIVVDLVSKVSTDVVIIGDNSSSTKENFRQIAVNVFDDNTGETVTLLRAYSANIGQPKFHKKSLP